MTKTILFVGGGIETLPGIRRARAMGLKTIVSDRNLDAPCMAEADAGLEADTYDARATLLAVMDHCARRGPIDGVLCLGSDIPWTVAVVADALGLPGIPLTAAALAMDKLAMKACFYNQGVDVPPFAYLHNLEMLYRVLLDWGRPIVIKPVDSRGARGVIRITEDTDAEWAFHYARACSPSGRVMAEKYLDGPQLSTESLIVNGVTHTPGMSDRNYDLLDTYAPFFIEDGGDLPSRLDDAVLEEVRQLVHRAGEALGVTNGVLKGDVVVHRGRPRIIEVAPRLSGGYFCTHTIPANTGVDFVGAAIRQALGEPLDVTALQPVHNRHVCQRYLFPTPGRVTTIEGVEAARRMPGITYLEVRIDEGDLVAPIENHPARAGVLMAEGEDRDEARTRAEAAVAAIRIHTTPEPPAAT